MSRNCLCFFIGTEAELIKVFPVIMLAEERGIDVKIISSGQNDISKSSVLQYANGGRVDLTLSSESSIKKNILGVFRWFFDTMRKSKEPLKRYVNSLGSERPIMVVHGDTVSTVMGARLGRQLAMKVAHVEAGLRSHNPFSPFPEEIDRTITGKLADIHFAPGEGACENLRNARGEVYDTEYNTVIDSLAYAKNRPCEDAVVSELIKKEYFVAVLHRQENLANGAFVADVVDRVCALAKEVTAVFILHEPTEIVLNNLGLLDKLRNAENVRLLKRREYFDFTYLLANAEYVITDGGSNQQELYYLGKPCMLLRKTTEGSEGLGKNCILYGEPDNILRFGKHYKEFRREEITPKLSPSLIIVDKLQEYLNAEGEL